ncbi:MAG TPA: hypothetical protein DIT97_01365 [Gimesia maris]|uniref:Uncharacterized protein n=1 Tax=Gimesia maris TaxID=122 RepID=A0A3D3R1D0_9PLAN|nr:hypothetical protein [Gimesia maris]|tara:strand:+ start:1440 stop:1622 length:183 start_codon:yes stop_codon:yes gene_type:complete
MHTRAVVLYEMEKPTPYAESKPLVIEELQLDDPGEETIIKYSDRVTGVTKSVLVCEIEDL